MKQIFSTFFLILGITVLSAHQSYAGDTRSTTTTRTGSTTQTRIRTQNTPIAPSGSPIEKQMKYQAMAVLDCSSGFKWDFGGYSDPDSEEKVEFTLYEFDPEKLEYVEVGKQTSADFNDGPEHFYTRSLFDVKKNAHYMVRAHFLKLDRAINRAIVFTEHTNNTVFFEPNGQKFGITSTE